MWFFTNHITTTRSTQDVVFYKPHNKRSATQNKCGLIGIRLLDLDISVFQNYTNSLPTWQPPTSTDEHGFVHLRPSPTTHRLSRCIMSGVQPTIGRLHALQCQILEKCFFGFFLSFSELPYAISP